MFDVDHDQFQKVLIFPRYTVMLSVIEQEEPCEGRLSSTVPWEREGEIPLRDSIVTWILHRISMWECFKTDGSPW